MSEENKETVIDIPLFGEGEYVEKEPTDIEKIQDMVRSAKNDYAILYDEVRQDMKHLKAKVASIKPVLKVEDPESEKFIRDVLSKHDQTVRTQQTAIEEKILQLRDIERKIENKVGFFQISVKEVNEKFDTVLKHLERIQTPKAPTFLEKVKALFK